MLAGERITSTAHLDIYALAGSLPASVLEQLAPQFEQAVVSVTERIGWPLVGRVAIGFEPPQTGACAIRGITLSHDRTIRLFYGPDGDPASVLAIVAHELAHEAQHDYYGWDAHQRSDNILLEGQASWASSDYSPGEDGQPGWQRRAQEALAAGELLPLTANLETDCRTTTRSAAYSGWASFVDFLIDTGGRERFDALYRSGQGRAAGSSDYLGVYGKNLDSLDTEWRVWLANQ